MKILNPNEITKVNGGKHIAEHGGGSPMAIGRSPRQRSQANGSYKSSVKKNVGRDMQGQHGRQA